MSMPTLIKLGKDRFYNGHGLTYLCVHALGWCVRQEVRIAMPREYSEHPLCKQVRLGGPSISESGLKYLDSKVL